jgi:hypothetical protein
MSLGENKYVFVVCGARHHIDTLHFSLAALRQFTSNEILVITDKVRNEIPVLHQQVLNIATPAHFDHHQASIYLKTGLHKFLPKGYSYCYLDADVIALSPEVDDVFKQKQGVISFAADHCSLRQFSPHAVHCNCAEQNKKDHLEINELLKQHGHNPPQIEPSLLPNQKQLQQKLEVIKRHKIELLKTAFRYSLSSRVFNLDEDTQYHRDKNYWSDRAGNPLLYETAPADINRVEENSAWRWNKIKRRWINPQGKDIQRLECAHLEEAIAAKFKTTIDGHWQHYNGGVFLFDEASHQFMEDWHQNTLTVFKDPYWKTRDQGSLIATVWQLGLQQMPLLSKNFNFIAYFYNPALMITADKTSISDDALVSQYSPAFIHVFDHFGVSGWDAWDWIGSKLDGEKYNGQQKGD